MSEQDKENAGKQKPNAGNGGFADNYYWTQVLDEVSVYVSLPENVTSKQLDVKILPNKLVVGLKGQPPIISGELFKKIKVDDSLWTLESDGPKRTL